ncbi:MAG: RNA recognition motif-containing protein [Lentisphaeria bacterium]|jgi:RNA recognition motif-containing protein
MKILIRNIARITTEAELKTMFEQFGTVQSCNLVLDKLNGESKGFGFVEMPRAGEAKAAIKSLNGFIVAKNALRVKKAEIAPELAAARSKTEASTASAAAPAKPAKPTKKKTPSKTFRATTSKNTK